jgi:DNA-binding SARP family transcriptional activator/tRNA A-37 threonylcarbamoyl transferase component Bud32
MIELLTLGGASLRRDGAELTGLSVHKQKLALTSYIAVEGPVARDNLLGMFWPEKPEDKARHSLSQVLYALRKELGEECVTTTGDQIELADDTSVDVKQLAAAGQGERWEEVVELYRGPFLDRFYLPEVHGFEDWQSRTRAWVSNLARKGFSNVVAGRSSAGDTKGALDVAWRWAKLEPVDDEAQHALIALLAISGDRPRALDVYDAYCERVLRELDVQPLPQTVAMMEAIRTGALPQSPLLGEAPQASKAQQALEIHEPMTPVPGPAADITGPVDIEKLLREELAPRLEIERKIGSSSTSDVYLAREPGLRRQVAVKVFSPKLADDRRARMRFDREVQAVASLTHPNITALHWAGSLSIGLPYFVMQYVEGKSLAEKLRVEGRLDNEDARVLLSQLASALVSAHRRGIVHRDVQPANILCDEESGRCLLTDFGIATLLSTAEEQTIRITESGELIGDPLWMSPEQVKAEGAAERSDIYGLGLLGYQLLAEESPYVWNTRQELYAAHVNQPPRRLSELRPDVDRDLDQLLEKCLAKEPHRRPSASHVRRALLDPTGPSPDLEPETEPDEWWQRLIWRRVPHWLGPYLVGGFGLIELIPDLIDREYLPEVVFPLTWISYLLGIPVVGILSWYHGRRGAQKFERPELWLLGLVALIWLAVLASLVL